jgi:23S rRNA C2498 (ribose-2'-O)-methylase RlmM
MKSELERRIQQLCAEVVDTNEPEKLDRLCRELQTVLRQYIGGLPDRVKNRNSAKLRTPKKNEN